MKIAIVIGHNSKAQGAVRVTDGRTEFDWNGQLAELIRAHDPSSIGIFYRDPNAGGYSREIDKVYGEVNASGAKLSLELHFNGSVNGDVSGGETYSSGSTNSLRLANLIRERVDAVMDNKNRGVKILTRTDNGGRSLWQGNPPAVLTEPYFGTYAPGCATADERMDQLAEAYYRAAVTFLGGSMTIEQVKPVAPPTASPERAMLAEIHAMTKPYA